MGWNVSRLAGLAALAMSSPAAAQNAPPAGARWIADWGADRCTLLRTGADSSPILAVRLLPGSERFELLFPGRTASRRLLGGSAAATVVLSDGTASEVTLDPGFPTEVRPPLIAWADVSLLDKLERSSIVTLQQGREVLAEVPIEAARPAFRVLRQCVDSLLTEWGIDPTARAALRSPPRAIPGGSPWLRSSDYPGRAVRDATSGAVIVRLTIDPAGRVTDCTILRSSGDGALDAATCRLLPVRARFEPALGADGQPTAAAVIREVDWMIPR